MVLLDKLATRQERDWYAAAAVEYGWSRNVLAHQVASRLVERVGSGRRTSAPRCWRRTQSWRSSWCATPTCSTTSRCPSAPLSASSQALMDRLQGTLLAFGDRLAAGSATGRRPRWRLALQDATVDRLRRHSHRLCRAITKFAE
jgi:hypothetical protein